MCAVDNAAPINAKLLEDFKTNSVHGAIVECCKLRPSVDISLQAESSVKEIALN